MVLEIFWLIWQLLIETLRHYGWWSLRQQYFHMLLKQRNRFFVQIRSEAQTSACKYWSMAYQQSSVKVNIAFDPILQLYEYYKSTTVNLQQWIISTTCLYLMSRQEETDWSVYNLPVTDMNFPTSFVLGSLYLTNSGQFIRAIILTWQFPLMLWNRTKSL